jgi:hypothetical protein
LPRVETLQRVRSNPKLAVAIAGGVLLVLAWIGWTIHVASDDGGRAALGVLIAWPALALAAALVALAVYGAYRLISRLAGSQGDGSATASADGAEPDDEEGGGSDDEEEDDGDEDAEQDEGSEGGDEEPEDEDEEEAEAPTKS